jgi:hypothetical protein
MREICQSGSEGGEVLSLPDLISFGTNAVSSDRCGVCVRYGCTPANLQTNAQTKSQTTTSANALPVTPAKAGVQDSYSAQTQTFSTPANAHTNPQTATSANALPVTPAKAGVHDSYNAQNQPAAASDLYYQALSYSPRGQVTQERRANNVALTVDRSFDAQTGRLAVQNVNSGSLQSWQLQFDKVGNLKERFDARTSQREVLTYDKLDRLTTVTRNGTNHKHKGHALLVKDINT